MRGRYEVEDLLKLRASPLVAKPPSLPPKEEWMGPADPRPRTATAKSKIDDAFNQVDGFQKRPSLLDSARRSTTDPERIHLGPPRNSFASSNAARTRNGAHERTKTNEDADQKFADRRTDAFGGTNGKFGTRTDDEHNGADHPRRRPDDSELDVRPRRDFDRTRWNNRDAQPDDEKLDEAGLRSGREGYLRAKFDQPWTRKEKPAEPERDSPAWRRGQRERESDRNDTEPEWVDSIESAEPAKAHTHEDFLQWMEKMKSKTSTEDQPAQPEMIQKEITTFGSGKPPPRVVSDHSASADKFFAKYEKDKLAEGHAVNAKPTKSRFASIFGSKDEPKEPSQTLVDSRDMLAPPPLPPQPAELEQPASAAKTAKTPNDAAFANLLKMLNQNQTASPPAPVHVPSTRKPINVAELSSTRSPDLGFAPPHYAHSTRTPVSHAPNLSLDRLIETRSPAQHVQTEQPSQPKAGPQDLLDLLRRSTLQDRQIPQQQPNYLPQQPQRMPPPPPGLSMFPSHDAERNNPQLINTRRDNPRSIFDDPAFSGYRNDPDVKPRAPQPNDHGGLPGLLAAMNSRGYATNSQQEQRLNTQAQPNPPPGLQRPPGLDHGTRPPPGWLPSNQQQRPQPPHPSNTAPQQSLYNQPAYSHQQPAPRQMPQRKPTGEMPLPPGFGSIPPGFGPSPTYASPTSPDPVMQYGISGGYGGIKHRDMLERERQQKAFAAMYGNDNGNRGGNPGVQLPPGFR